MRKLRALLMRVFGFVRARHLDRDLQDEIAGHLGEATDEYVRQGHSPTEARLAALRSFGGVTRTQEAHRDARSFLWLDNVWRDLKYAVRTLRRTPGFTAVSVLTLALGIGANTAIFSLLNAVLLRRLPVRNPQELMFLGNAIASGSTGFIPNGNTRLFSYEFFRDFRRDNQIFSDVAAIDSILFRTYGRIAGGADLEKLKVELVSGSYFTTLGVPAVAGRTLGDSDDQAPGEGPVAVASYSWVQRRFGTVQSVIGSTVSIASRLYVIVGVAPPGFSGMTVGQAPDLWVPLTMQREISPGWNGLENPMFQTLHVVARMKQGVTVAQAQVSTNLLFHNILREYVGADASENTLKNIQRAYIALTPAATGRSPLRRQFSSPLMILMVVVGVVLLIACANVANLLLAQATARQREIAVRMALGAGRLQLVRQLLTESLSLGAAGAALGLLLASSASHLLITLVSTGTEPLPIAVGPDVTVLAFTTAMAIGTLLIFGAIPAFCATKLNLTASLKDGGTVVSSTGRSGLPRWLVISEIALSLALVAGAMLFLQSLTKLRDLDTGFDKRNVLVTAIEPGAAGYTVDGRLESMMTRVEERIASIPGVHGASFVYFLAFNGGSWSTDDIAVPGPQQSTTNASVVLNLVGPQYLDVMRMPILAGRTLSADDTASSRRVAVINETMARLYFGEPFPLGRTFTVQDEEKTETTDLENIEVVGIVRDAKYTSLDEQKVPAAFFPHAQHRRNFLYTLVARYDGDASRLVPAMRRAIAEADTDLPIGDITTLERLIDDSVVNRRAIAELSSLFGLIAVVLACIGIYGVTSYGIARRTNEFSVRMALGASRFQVLRLVLGEVMRTACLGIGVGLIIAFGFGRVVSSMLFGLAPHDPFAISVAVLMMVVVSLVAGYVPAWRATRIDPLTALRHD